MTQRGKLHADLQEHEKTTVKPHIKETGCAAINWI